MIGQSNMAGRGKIEQATKIENENLLVLRNGRWQKRFFPVNPDRSFSGVSLAETFIDLYQKEKGVEVGLIPCADGGTSLNQWAVGGLLFDHACYMAELASRTSNIAGVLWHQGEADCKEYYYPDYYEKLTAIIKAFKKRLNLYDVPFLLGGLGDFLKDCTLDKSLVNYQKVNGALERVAGDMEMTAFVSAEGLTSNPDNLHFNSKSLEEFGKRYYEEFKKLERKDKVFYEKSHPDKAIRTEMELL